MQHPADADDSDTITTHFEYHSMEANLLKLDMLGHDDPTMVRMMQDLTGVDPHAIPLDDPDTMSIFTSSKVLGYENDEILGPTGAVAIPEFNTRFTRQMLVDTQPKDFNTLVRLSGFSHGTDVWLGNARDLIVSGTATVLETVGCRDDIMLYLISKGLDPKMSFKIMEKVRKGKVKKGGFDEGWVEAMEEHDVPAVVHRLPGQDRLPLPEGPRGGLRYDGLPHCLVQGPRALGLLRHLLLRPGQGLRRGVSAAPARRR